MNGLFTVHHTRVQPTHEHAEVLGWCPDGYTQWGPGASGGRPSLLFTLSVDSLHSLVRALVLLTKSPARSLRILSHTGLVHTFLQLCPNHNLLQNNFASGLCRSNHSCSSNQLQCRCHPIHLTNSSSRWQGQFPMCLIRWARRPTFSTEAALPHAITQCASHVPLTRTTAFVASMSMADGLAHNPPAPQLQLQHHQHSQPLSRNWISSWQQSPQHSTSQHSHKHLHSHRRTPPQSGQSSSWQSRRTSRTSFITTTTSSSRPQKFSV